MYWGSSRGQIALADLSLVTTRESAARWVGEFLETQLQGVVSDVVRASKVPGELEKGALEFVTRIASIERLRESAEREVKKQIHQDAKDYKTG